MTTHDKDDAIGRDWPRDSGENRGEFEFTPERRLSSTYIKALAQNMTEFGSSWALERFHFDEWIDEMPAQRMLCRSRRYWCRITIQISEFGIVARWPKETPDAVWRDIVDRLWRNLDWTATATLNGVRLPHIHKPCAPHVEVPIFKGPGLHRGQVEFDKDVRFTYDDMKQLAEKITKPGSDWGLRWDRDCPRDPLADWPDRPIIEMRCRSLKHNALIDLEIEEHYITGSWDEKTPSAVWEGIVERLRRDAFFKCATMDGKPMSPAAPEGAGAASAKENGHGE